MWLLIVAIYLVFVYRLIIVFVFNPEDFRYIRLVFLGSVALGV